MENNQAFFHLPQDLSTDATAAKLFRAKSCYGHFWYHYDHKLLIIWDYN